MSDADDKTYEDPDDFATLLAQAEAELSGDDSLADDEAGPSDEGELTDESVNADPDLEHDEDLDDEDFDEITDEDEDDSEDDTLADEDEDPEEKDEPDPELLAAREEVTTLRESLQAMQAQVQALSQLVQSGVVPAQQQQQAPRVDPVLAGAVRAAFTGDEESFKSLPPQTKQEALKAIRDSQEREALYLLDPERRYAEQIAGFVEQHIQAVVSKHVGPLVEQRQQARVDEVLAPYQSILADPVQKKRFTELVEKVPGNADQWEQRLAVAAELLEKERGVRKLDRREQKLKTRERQVEAKRSARRRSGSRGKGKVRREDPPRVVEPEDVFSPEHLAWVEKQVRGQ